MARSLDAERLFGAPAETAAAAADHLGVIGADLEVNARQFAGHYAKDPLQPFDEGARLRREEQDRVRLSAEIATARRWIERSPAARELTSRLARPLLGTAPVLPV